MRVAGKPPPGRHQSTSCSATFNELDNAREINILAHTFIQFWHLNIEGMGLVMRKKRLYVTLDMGCTTTSPLPKGQRGWREGVLKISRGRDDGKRSYVTQEVSLENAESLKVLIKVQSSNMDLQLARQAWGNYRGQGRATRPLKQTPTRQTFHIRFRFNCRGVSWGVCAKEPKFNNLQPTIRSASLMLALCRVLSHLIIRVAFGMEQGGPEWRQYYGYYVTRIHTHTIAGF